MDDVALPITEYRPLSRRQREELEGYVAWSTAFWRAVIFILVGGVVGVLSWTARGFLEAAFSVKLHNAWWLVPTVALSLWVLMVSGRWTGGRALRSQIRQDLLEGIAAVRRVSATDAIEVEEGEDEGPAFFILTNGGQTLLVAYQELDRLVRRGFPWKEFEIIEAPHSHTFFGLKKIGENLRPSYKRPPLSFDEFRLFDANKHFQVLDVDFASLGVQSQVKDAG